MELKDLVAVSGQGGLHKIIGKSKTGLILETLATGKRFATSFQDKVSVLEDISMYTADEDMRLAQVFVHLHEAGSVPTAQDEVKTQRQFLVDTIKLDSERVYDSDIKKLINWYNILKDSLDFEKLKTDAAEEKANENAEGGTDEVKKETTHAPKNAAPKKASAKINTKGTGAKTTYRTKAG